MSQHKDVVSFITVPYKPTTRVVKTVFSQPIHISYSENKLSDSAASDFFEFPPDLEEPQHQTQPMDQSFYVEDNQWGDQTLVDISTLPILPIESANENPLLALSFWGILANLICKIAGIAPENADTFRQSITKHCQTLNLQHEPLEIQVIQWIFGDFSTHLQEDLQDGVPFQLTFRLFENDLLDDETLTNHLQWHQMTNLQRYYYLYCASNYITQEKSQDDPYLEPWYFQYLLLCILFGSDYMATKAHALLMSVNLNVWCSEYLYCGGLVREGMITMMSYLGGDNRRLSTVLDVVLGTMQDHPKDDSKIAYWVAFFEQVDNLIHFQGMLSKYLEQNQEDQSFKTLQETLNRIPLEEFTTRKMKQGVFKCIKSVQNGMVELLYHGCPKTVSVDQSKIPAGKILESLKNFVSNKTIQ